MIQVALSKILPEFHNFEEQHGQLYLKDGEELKWFDMLYITRTHKLYLFLYILHKYGYKRPIFIGYEPVHIINDVTTLQETELSPLFDMNTFYDIESCLPDYNITTPQYPDPRNIKRLAIVPLKRFEEYAVSEDGLAGYAKHVCEQINIPDEDISSLIPTEVFIDCELGTNTRVYITPLRTLISQGYIYTYVNAGYNAFKEEVILQAPTSAKYSSTTVDGWTTVDGRYIWWLITHIPGEERSYSVLKSFYDYLVGLPTANIYISSKGLLKGENTLVSSQLNFKATADYSIPTVVLNLLALVHINTGKVIEFIGIQQRYRDIYLRAVSEYASRSMCELKSRIDAFNNVKEGELYLTFIHDRISSVKVTQKNMNLKFKVVHLADITNRIVAIDNEYSISVGIIDSLPFPEWNDSNFDVNKIEFLSLYDAVLQDIFVEDTAEKYSANTKKAESYLYAILRLLEQKFFQFRKAKTIADLILFKYNQEVYVGFGSLKSEYTSEIYLCAGKIASKQTIVRELIPVSVIIEEEPTPQQFKQLLEICQPSKPLPFSSAETQSQILALSATKVPGLPFSYKDDISQVDTSTPAYTLIDASIARYCNFTVRKEIWDELTQQFTSFGLRSLSIHTAPVTIYGGLNVTLSDRAQIQVYPVSFDKFPRRT